MSGAPGDAPAEELPGGEEASPHAAAGTPGQEQPAPAARVLPARVGINAVFLLPGMGGLDTYVAELVPEMARLAPGTSFSIFCTPAGRSHLRQHDWANKVELVTHPLLGRRGLKAASELTVLGYLASRRVDLLHSVALTAPLYTRAANVVTIADVTWLDDTGTQHATTLLWRLVVPPVARRADRVIAISQAAAGEVERRLRVPRERIDVTLLGHGTGRGAAPLPEPELRRRFGLGDGPLVLNVGTRKPHKNLLRLVQAMPAVRARSPQAKLVLCGNPTSHDAELRAEAAQLGLEGEVMFLGFVAPEELEGLYAAASCFAFPSLTEGFGLPILEAMDRDLPVACSNVSVMPEVAGEAAQYFDPHDADAIAGAIAPVLEQPQLAARLAEQGRRRAAGFTWQRTAEATLDSYERAWGAHRLARSGDPRAASGA